MQATVDMFKARQEEINLYYSSLQALYKISEEQRGDSPITSHKFLKILKSNALLMLYNLVESTVMNGILSIYDALSENEITYSMVSKEIQNIWFSHKFNEVYDKNSNFNSYQKKANEIIDLVLEEGIIKLNRKAAAISGNLDADAIRDVCKNHGIKFKTSPSSKGGQCLGEIKDRRNGLSHGRDSFVECGRDYTLAELEKIKEETVCFLSDLLDGMQDYYNNQRYLSKK